MYLLLPSSVPVASSVQVKLKTEISLIISVRPPHPTPPRAKYVRATCRPPWKLKFGMEALFNKLAS